MFFIHIFSLVEHIFPLFTSVRSEVLPFVPPVISVALPSSAPGVLNAPLPPTMSKNPPVTAISAQEVGLAEETQTQAFCDQANCIAVNQEVSSFQAIAVPEQGLAAVSAEASAGRAALEECGPPSEAPLAFLGPHVVTAEGQQNDCFAAVEKLSTQDIEPVSDDALGEDVGPGHEDGRIVSPKTSLDGQADEDKMYPDVVLENDISDMNTPILLSKSFQTKRTDKYEATHHPSGWFILHENQTHVSFFHLFFFYMQFEIILLHNRKTYHRLPLLLVFVDIDSF